MIIIYEQASGKLLRFQVGACLNADTHQADGYINVNPGGRFDGPPADQDVLNFDETADPLLGHDVERAIYDGSGKYVIINGVLTLA